MMQKTRVTRLLSLLKKRYSFVRIEKNSFLILIKTILSQRTRDSNTETAAKQLFAEASTPERILKLNTKKLQILIKPAGFYKQKAKRIKEVCNTLIEKYGGNVPKNRDELLKLPGVGFKTADIVLSYGYGIPTIAVDTHVNQITKRIGLVDEKADVEEVRKTLEKFIKGGDRFIVNAGLVKFGQEVCKPRNPKCHVCELREVCGYYKNIKSIS